MESAKMSKLFTKDRRVMAKADFDSRLELTLQKKRIKQKQLEKKFYDFDFKPKINKRRININPKSLHKNVYSRKTKGSYVNKATIKTTDTLPSDEPNLTKNCNGSNFVDEQQSEVKKQCHNDFYNDFDAKPQEDLKENWSYSVEGNQKELQNTTEVITLDSIPSIQTEEIPAFPTFK